MEPKTAITEEQVVEEKKSFISEAQEIYEKKWAGEYKGLGKMFDNPAKVYRAAQTVQMLENQQKYMKSLNETTITTKFGDIAPRVLDILRLVYPNQVAHELVDVQTMKSVVDVVYFVKPVYAQTKGTSLINSTAFSSPYQASEETEDAVGTGNGVLVNFKSTPSYDPIRTKTLRILENGIPVAEDDGAGVIAGTSPTYGAITGTIDYAGGADAIDVTFASAPASAVEISAVYYFNSEEDPASIGEVDIVFSTFQVKARKHPLRLRWTVDAALTTQGNLNFDVEDALSMAGAQELKAQKDFSVTRDLRRVAGAVNASLTFDADLGATPQYAEWQHAQGFRRTLAKSNNVILNDVGRGMASWLVVGTDVEEYMTYLDNYVEDPNKTPIGVYKSGSYRGKPVFIDQKQNTDEFLAGYKGRLFGDAGYILAEYIELYATPTVELDDFIGRKGLASFYDKKVITPGYFKRGKIANV